MTQHVRHFLHFRDSRNIPLLRQICHTENLVCKVFLGTRTGAMFAISHYTTKDKNSISHAKNEFKNGFYNLKHIKEARLTLLLTCNDTSPLALFTFCVKPCIECKRCLFWYFLFSVVLGQIL